LVDVFYTYKVTVAIYNYRNLIFLHLKDCHFFDLVRPVWRNLKLLTSAAPIYKVDREFKTPKLWDLT